MERLFPKEFLDRYGFEAPGWTVEDARAYTRWLAGGHYENFHVVSLLLPKRLHQDFFNVYAYCRWADDLGDELGDPARSLEALGWWRAELHAMYAGRTAHPVFVALAETVARHAIPEEPFEHLIRAFEADQRKTRYATYEEVLEYCVWSANPVGRLVLRLCGYADPERVALSDATCTALQLANHWQDVRRDFFDRDRIYLPEDVMRAHGYGHEALCEDLRSGRGRAEGRAAISDLVGRARLLFEAGRPLADLVDRRLAVDLELFRRGGLAVLDKIERQGGDVFGRRPRIGKFERVGLLVRVLASRAFGGGRRRESAQAAQGSIR
jgi:squalene synthase HpnC